MTAGVNTCNYACFAELVITGSAQRLMYGSDHTQVMMGYENILGGSIFLITDQNSWDHVYAVDLNDNAVMFENLLVVRIHPTVPVPGAVLLAGIGMGLTGWLRRRKIV